MPTSSVPTELTITAAEANRGFSRLLREVRDGASYVVTSHGRPVAKITPYDSPEAHQPLKTQAERDAALQALLNRLRTQPVQNIGPWTRDELYERGRE
jgi:prevent-host-death family protein